MLSRLFVWCFVFVELSTMPVLTSPTTSIFPPSQEMSDEYKAAQAKLMLEQASDVDVNISTALIPRRKALVLVNQEMLNLMKAERDRGPGGRERGQRRPDRG